MAWCEGQTNKRIFLKCVRHTNIITPDSGPDFGVYSPLGTCIDQNYKLHSKTGFHPKYVVAQHYNKRSETLIMNNLQLETFCGEFRLKRYAPFISDFYDFMILDILLTSEKSIFYEMKKVSTSIYKISPVSNGSYHY